MCAAGHVTPDRVVAFIDELKARVSSVTVHTNIHCLKRIAQLLAPQREFTWLAEIENDLALVMEPRSKFDRFVYAQRLLAAGLALMDEADKRPAVSALHRAQQYRNGLMVAFLALHPKRLKNFAVLEIGRSFRRIEGTWWVILNADETKEKRPDEVPVDEGLNQYIERYLNTHRPILAQGREDVRSLWLSTRAGACLSTDQVQRVINGTTARMLGLAISPHMFRTAIMTTAAVFGRKNNRLGSAVLNHRGTRTGVEHYNRPSTLQVGLEYAQLIRRIREEP
jgi:hypothetical protein